jgi:predicted transcriptional regulator
MKNTCEIIARHILPAFRSLIAQGLIEEHGFTQVAAAEKLGTTQAAISYYLSSKRGEKYINLLEDNPHIKTKIKEIVEGLVTNSFSSEEVSSSLCGLCNYLQKNDQITVI